jgi:predicted enzyme related to lactoylglutathione lyase
MGTNDFEKAKRFYGSVLGTLGCRIVMQHPGAAAFWDGEPAKILGMS